MAKTQLKDICSFSKGCQINGDKLIENGEYDYLNGGINPSGKWNEYNVSGNTVTISEGGNSSGYVNYMPNSFWCGAHCYYLYDLKCDVKYLYYALKSQQDRIMKLRSGACMPNIKKSDIGTFEFEYSSDTNVQKQIAANLDKVTHTIDLCNNILEKLDLLVKARFVEMFGYVTERRKLEEYAELITKGASPKWQGFDYADEGYFNYWDENRYLLIKKLGVNNINVIDNFYSKVEEIEKSRMSVCEEVMNTWKCKELVYQFQLSNEIKDDPNFNIEKSNVLKFARNGNTFSASLPKDHLIKNLNSFDYISSTVAYDKLRKMSYYT